MQKAAPLLVSLAIIAVLILITGCVSPGGNETPTATPTSMPTAETTAPTTTPAETAAPPTPTPTANVTPTPTATPAEPEQVTIDLVAENIAFDTETITVPAGAEVTINFENRDAVQHNFAVYESSDAGTIIFRGEIIGRGNATYTFTAPEEPGTYFFRCDVHPAQMTGTFVAE
jgi:plastocyanin